MTIMKLRLAILSGFLLAGVLTFGAEGETLPDRGLCSHRGVNSTHPENTLPAFAEAIRLGAAMVEFDVWQTKDGHLVILHDATVDRTTNGKGKVSEMTFEEVRALDAGIKKSEKFAGTKIPTFDETVDSLPRNVWMNVHLKDSPAVAVEVARKIVEKKRTHQAFLACSRRCALAAKEKYPEIKICNMERQGGDVPRYIRESIEWKCEFLQLTKLGTPEEMQNLRKVGVKINFFHARNVEQFKQLVEAGVDFPLVDDFPKFMDAAREVGMLPKE